MSTASQFKDQHNNGHRRAPISGRPRLFGELSKPVPFDVTLYQHYTHMRATQQPTKKVRLNKAERAEAAKNVKPRPKFLPHAARPLSVAKGANGRFYALLSNGSIVRVQSERVVAPPQPGDHPKAVRFSTTHFVKLHNGGLEGVML